MAGRTHRLPRRSRRYGVGKKIGGAVYLHRSCERLLGEGALRARQRVPEDYAYTVVKHTPATGRYAFIFSPDFDTSPEPLVGDQWVVSQDGTARLRKQAADPFVYHHKWLMVSEEYTGFDVQQSRTRSEWWLALPDIDRLRIGRRSYWLGVLSSHPEPPPCTSLPYLPTTP
jgi:hypothetical protein